MVTIRTWVAAGGMLLLAACAGSPQQQYQSPDKFPESDKTTTMGTSEPVPAVAALPVPEPAPEPVPDIQAFMNQTGTEIAGIFGEASFVRRDPPAELWQYRASECTLDLFLYDDGYGTYRLAHYDFRGATFTKAREDDCLREIIHLTDS